MDGGQHWGTGGGVALGGCLHWGWPRVSRITLGPYPLPLAHIIVRVMAPEKDNGHSRMGAAYNNFGYRVAAGQTEAESGRLSQGYWCVGQLLNRQGGVSRSCVRAARCVRDSCLTNWVVSGGCHKAARECPTTFGQTVGLCGKYGTATGGSKRESK